MSLVLTNRQTVLKCAVGWVRPCVGTTVRALTVACVVSVVMNIVMETVRKLVD